MQYESIYEKGKKERKREGKKERKRERKKERKKERKLFSIKQLDLRRALVKASGPNQNDWGGGTNRADLVP